MRYKVKEIFYTLQGEGRHTGRPAVFCRFSMCNLWTGRERDRHRAKCTFCDTDFVGTDGPGGGRFTTPEELCKAVVAKWPDRAEGAPMVVCTGGEPLLQLDQDAIDAFHSTGLFVAVETNGTVVPPCGIDWLCVSPKAGTTLAVSRGDELKLVYPQQGCDPSEFGALAFEYFSIQPLDDENVEDNVRVSVNYCLEHPRWRLSLQTHKIVGIR